MEKLLQKYEQELQHVEAELDQKSDKWAISKWGSMKEKKIANEMDELEQQVLVLSTKIETIKECMRVVKAQAQ